jgi:hypothetical protein
MEITKPEISQVQQFSALNAFKSNRVLNKEENVVEKETSSGTNTSSSTSLLDKVNVSEIKEYAKFAGEYNITDDDIKYGLMYGRSVIAEWLC